MIRYDITFIKISYFDGSQKNNCSSNGRSRSAGQSFITHH